jgi:hypothetical protein
MIDADASSRDWWEGLGLTASQIARRSGLSDGQTRGALARLVSGGSVESMQRVLTPTGRWTCYVLEPLGARLVLWAVEVGYLEDAWVAVAKNALRVLKVHAAAAYKEAVELTERMQGG